MTLEELKNITVDHDIMKLGHANRIKRIYLRDLLCNEELLVDVFHTHKMTVYAFENMLKEMGLSGNIRGFCKELNIKLPDAREGALRSMSKRYKTNKERYGGTGNLLSAGSVLKEKRDSTVRKKYGVDNVFQLDSVKKQIRKTNLLKYGSLYFNTSEFRKIPDKNFSVPHKKVSAHLTLCGIEHENEIRGRFEAFNDYYNKIYSPIPDIIVENSKLILEIYGDYWHGNPQIYKKTDLIYLYEGKTKVEDVWERDEARLRHIESFGYKVFVIWESEVNSGAYKGIVNEIFKNKIY